MVIILKINEENALNSCLKKKYKHFSNFGARSTKIRLFPNLTIISVFSSFQCKFVTSELLTHTV